jgi:hypothetical protein
VLFFSKHRRSILVAAVVLALAFWFSNPLRWPQPAVRAWLLWQVPIGSSQSQLQHIASTTGWQIKGTWPGHQPHSDWGGIDGATVVWVYLGGYRTVLRADLDSFWAFDEHGHLADVRIRKVIDAP